MRKTKELDIEPIKLLVREGGVSKYHEYTPMTVTKLRFLMRHKPDLVGDDGKVIPRYWVRGAPLLDTDRTREIVNECQILDAQIERIRKRILNLMTETEKVDIETLYLRAKD